MEIDYKLHGLEQFHLKMYDDFLYDPLSIPDLIDFFEKAEADGIELQAISSYRGFEQQLTIWNNKAIGNRTLLDSNSKPLEFSSLTEKEIVDAILRWSALPGFSRHHWGTDFDVIDAKVLKDNPEYEVQLIPSEYEQNGIFQNLGTWLEENLPSSPFFRPYSKDLGGVAPEAWHLSHKASSYVYEQKLSFEYFNTVINSDFYNTLHLIQVVRENAEMIFEKYVDNISR